MLAKGEEFWGVVKYQYFVKKMSKINEGFSSNLLKYFKNSEKI